ncbi:MAG: hypothetical protein JW794_02935 [Candidatus Cloacimonetes bacterium]|nr:hypothetical protein [Candidatus Cloacimonadota bacterium]
MKVSIGQIMQFKKIKGVKLPEGPYKIDNFDDVPRDMEFGLFSYDVEGNIAHYIDVEKLKNGSEEEKELLEKFKMYSSLLSVETLPHLMHPKDIVDIEEVNDHILLHCGNRYFSIWDEDNCTHNEKYLGLSLHHYQIPQYIQ